ncbi:ribosome biogenesis protein WDR12 homolog isoform X2 [Dysidea avara]|uniref:ribosome biogenesis protein WDR12 homolog isoform X2 n=1 Tax=Dysidea avara TaxID=196820 RepID=UPI0033291AFC
MCKTTFLTYKRNLHPATRAIPDHAFSIPQSLDQDELSKLVNEIIGNDEKKEFDFVINEELLRTTIGQHLTDRLIGNEAVVEIECIEKNAPPEPLHVLQHSDWVSCVQCHQKYLLSGCYDNKVYMWYDNEQLAVMEGHSRPVTDVKWINSVFFLSASQDQGIFLWKWSEGDQCADVIYHYKGHAQSVEKLAVSPSKNKFCSVSWDKFLKIWSCSVDDDADDIDPEVSIKIRRTAKGKESKPTTRTPLVTLAGHTQPVRTVVWPHEGELFTAGYDHSIRIWDLESNTTTDTLQGNKVFLDISYSEHNHLIASASTDGHVRLWDPRQQGGAMVQSTFQSHKGWVSSVQWSPSHTHQLASSSYDHTLRIWDTRSSRFLHSIAAHSDKVLCMDWSRHDVLASGSADNTLRTYTVSV